MKVAVITPFHNEPRAWLLQAQRSVIQQTYPCHHILVGDAPLVSGAAAGIHVTLPVNVGDFGDTPRAVGSLYAAGLGFDAVAYLDADNWFYPDHIASLIALYHRTGAAIMTSRRAFHRLDGSYMAECATSDGQQFADTNCLLITRPAFGVFAQWALMDAQLHAIDDRVMWHHIQAGGYSSAHTGTATVAYRVTHAGIYKDLGETPPAGVKTAESIVSALEAWERFGYPPLRYKWWYRRYAAPETAKGVAPSSTGNTTL